MLYTLSSWQFHVSVFNCKGLEPMDTGAKLSFNEFETRVLD